MQFEVGMTVDAKVLSITSFGAFLDIGGGRSGMVHISEISSSYVKDIRDFLKEGQEVKAKIVNISSDGKINLSIKKATEQTEFKKPEAKTDSRKKFDRPLQTGSDIPDGPASFEDMMSKFKQTSDERMAGMKRSDGNRRSTARSRRK